MWEIFAKRYLLETRIANHICVPAISHDPLYQSKLICKNRVMRDFRRAVPLYGRVCYFPD
jgi:hypothetical protein